MLFRRLFSPVNYSRRWKSVKVACASGFWGDTAVSTPQLVHSSSPVNYIVYDYLSEITMSLLARMRLKDPKAGFCPDFLAFHMAPHLKQIRAKNIKIVSNAGGLNPTSCAEKLAELAKQQGINDLKIAVITGDDILSQQKTWAPQNAIDLETGKPLPTTAEITSLNVYFGGVPIAKALALGADVVITGRCADSSLALGPLMHEFGWSPTDYDKLALGSLAGHLIECGAQVTGGICTDWPASANSWHNIGFPIVEFDGTDSFVVTKPKGSGGVVNFGTVAEQLIYEIGDPAAYLLPDVTVDFRDVRLVEQSVDGASVISVSGVKGSRPSSTYKASGSYVNGYRCVAVCPVIGGNAREKAEATANAILKRSRQIFKTLKMEDFSNTSIQVLGTEQSYGIHKRTTLASRECVLWLGVQHSNKAALELFSREIAPAGTGMAPGLTNIVGGRPTVAPVLKLCSFLVPKTIEAKLFVNGSLSCSFREAEASESSRPVTPVVTSQWKNVVPAAKGAQTIPLNQLAYARSGDKGDTANIGVVCRDPAFYPYLKARLTEKFVADYFSHFLSQDSLVKRYELDGISGLNFVLTHSLGGGGVASLRCDPQGKAYAQMLLDAELHEMPTIAEMKKQ